MEPADAALALIQSAMDGGAKTIGSATLYKFCSLCEHPKAKLFVSEVLNPSVSQIPREKVAAFLDSLNEPTTSEDYKKAVDIITGVDGDPLDNLPIPPSVVAAIKRAGVKNVTDLRIKLEEDEIDLESIKGVGRSSVANIMDALRPADTRLPEDPPSGDEEDDPEEVQEPQVVETGTF